MFKMNYLDLSIANYYSKSFVKSFVYLQLSTSCSDATLFIHIYTITIPLFLHTISLHYQEETNRMPMTKYLHH